MRGQIHKLGVRGREVDLRHWNRVRYPVGAKVQGLLIYWEYWKSGIDDGLSVKINSVSTT